jgi:hypothetical protein
MKYLVCVMLALFLVSCGSTKVLFLDGETRTALPDETPVAVFIEEEPTFLRIQQKNMIKDQILIETF